MASSVHARSIRAINKSSCLSKMESTPSKKWLHGFKKVPQYEDLLKARLSNAHKYIYLPERYVFTASHAAEGASDL